MSKRLAGLLLAVFILLVCVGSASADPGFQPFQQSGMDGQNTNRSPFAAPDAAPKVAWVYQLEPGWSPGSMVCGPDGTLYVVVSPTEKTMFDATARLLAIGADGVRKWEADRPSANVLWAPAVDSEGNLYLHSVDTICSLSADGRERWTYSAEDGVFTGLRLIPGRGILTVGRLCMLTPDGRELWGRSRSSGGAAIAGEDEIVFFGDADRGHGMYVLSMDGTVERFASTATCLDVSVTPGGNFLLPCIGGMLECYSSAGEKMWTWKTHDFLPLDPAVAPNGDIYIYGMGQREIMCLTSDRQVKWTTDFVGETCTRPMALPDSSVLACGTADRAGVFRIGADGKMIWRVDLPETTAADRVIGSPTVSRDGVIFVALESGRIVALGRQ